MTTSLTDAVNMNPSIKLTTIKKMVIYFSKGLTYTTKKTIQFCLEIIRFGMSSTLIYFDGKYYEYHVEENKEQGLSIGGYESDLLANLVASYLFNKFKNHLIRKIYHVIYSNDGTV